MAVKIANVLIEHPLARFAVDVDKYLKLPKVYGKGESTEWNEGNTFRALRHLAIVGVTVPANLPGNEVKQRNNTIEDYVQANKILDQLEKLNKDDEDAPFVWLDDATHAWALDALKTRPTLFGIATPGVLKAVETVVKDEDAKIVPITGKKK